MPLLYDPRKRKYVESAKLGQRKRSYKKEDLTYHRKKLAPGYWVRKYIDTGLMFVTWQGKRSKTRILCSWEQWCAYEYKGTQIVGLRQSIPDNPFETQFEIEKK